MFDPGKFSKAFLIVMNDHKRFIYLFKENVLKSYGIFAYANFKYRCSLSKHVYAQKACLIKTNLPDLFLAG